VSFETTPLTELFGVEIKGVDLATLDADGYTDLRAAFEEHSALLVRNQTVDDAAHLRLARMFGPVENREAADLRESAGYKVPEVSNIRADGSITGAEDIHTLNLKANMLWHIDSTFLPIPALTNILIARIVTETGGETQLASSRAGWAEMPENLKQRIRNKSLCHHFSHSRASISPELADMPMFHRWPEQRWPAVIKNPVNGREALYIASHAFKIDGEDQGASATLIEELTAFITQPRYVYSHKWQVGDVLIWDQRAVLHRATPWNYDEPRKLTSLCVSLQPEDGLDAMHQSA
jgi:alpha-ketoglutarate-dependent 2,4-dichlorophenoxyacetate dioxygenase